MSAKVRLAEMWWAECVSKRNQLHGLNAEHRGLIDTATDQQRLVIARPTRTNKRWKTKVATQWLWLSFKGWVDVTNPVMSEEITKIGFLMNFYRVSGSTKSTLTNNSDKEVPAARFEGWNNYTG